MAFSDRKTKFIKRCCDTEGGGRILCGEIIALYCDQHINVLHGQNIWLYVVQRVVYLSSSFKNSRNYLAQFKEILWYNLPEVLM